MIGGNANLEFYKQIDNLNERIDANTADKYSNTKTYSKDEYCIYNDTLYKANQDISTPEEFTVAHWDKTTILEEFNMLSSRVDALGNMVTITLSEGVWLYHNKNIVFINISTEGDYSVGWNTIATIPQELRPNYTVNFMLGDNSSDSGINNTAVFSRIVKENGNINIYAYSDKTSLQPIGYVIYIL